MSTERGDAILARAVQALAEIEAASETPSRVEAAVMAQWDASRRSRAKADLSRRSGAKADRSRTSRFVRGAATTAAGVTLVAGLVWQQGAFESTAAPTSPAPQPGLANQDAGARYQTVAVVGGPLQVNEPIRVVRMRVAWSVLSELGISSAARADTVDIDVLVGEDGVARGVRVPISEL
jgi:hypothetical protein